MKSSSSSYRKPRAAAAAALVVFFVWGVACSSADVGGNPGHHHAHHHKHVVTSISPHQQSDGDADSDRENHPHQQFSGPLAPGLSVIGGSKLRRTARRIRKFREVRASNKLPPSERVPHDVVRRTTTRTAPPRPIEKQQQQHQQTHPYYENPQGTTTSHYHHTHSSSMQQVAPPAIEVESSTHQYEQVTTSSQHRRMLPQAQQQGQEELNIRYETYIAPPQHEQPLSAAEATKPLLQDQRQNNQSNNNSKMAIVYMSLLAVQFGMQPLLVSKFAPRGICKSSVVLTQEVFKFAIAYWAYQRSTTTEQRHSELGALSIKSWLTMAGVPAALYTVQNLAALLAYQNLEALTFNVLNQTKVLTSALCCYLIMGKKQSTVQSLSLMLLIVSALVIEKIISLKSIMTGLSFVGGTTSAAASTFSFDALKSMALGSRRFTHGVIPVLLASFISGLAGALTQKNLQGVSKSSSSSQNNSNNKIKSSAPKNAYLFSMELTAASVVVLVLSLFVSADGRRIAESGFFHGWTPKVVIPILTNSIGGILVGLVTKHAGSVRKGFALIFGLLLSGIIQAAGSAGVSHAQIIGGLLAGVSLWLHSSYPSKSK